MRSRLLAGLFVLMLASTGFLAFSRSSRAADLPADPFGPGPWEDLGEDEGIKLGRKRLPDSALFAVRGETLIPVSVAKVASVICDHQRWTEWTKSLERAQLLSPDPLGNPRVVLQGFDLPFPVHDREVVFSYGWQTKGDLVEILGTSVEHPNAPVGSDVRMQLATGRWQLKALPEKKTRLVLEILMDPRGALPSWFVNLVQKRYPVETLSRLRTQAMKPNIAPLALPAEFQ